MPVTRRLFLQRATAAVLGLLGGTGGFLPRFARAEDPRPAFAATALADALAALGAADAQPSDQIQFKTPEIAENGAVVPVEVESRLPGTRAIAILVEKNPHVMSAEFTIPDGTEPYVATRVKVAESSNVMAVVKTDQGVFTASRLVKVTLGGCGG